VGSWVLPESYRPFVGNAAAFADCYVRVCTGTPAFTISDLPFQFVSKTIWAAFPWYDDGWGFITPLPSAGDWERLLLWSPQTNSADLWIGRGQPTQDIFGGLKFAFLAALFAQHQGALLHAAAVMVDGEAVLFVGQSGQGKSHWAHQCQALGYPVLDEDRLAVRVLDGRVWAFGVPWHPAPRLCSPVGAPVKSIYFLQQALPDTRAPVTKPHATSLLVKAALLPVYDPLAMQSVLDVLAQTALQAQVGFVGRASDERFVAETLAL